jgi:hypothetical protein
MGENDVAVKWTTKTNGYLLNMTNTRKDVALKISVISYKKKSGVAIPQGSENDLSKMSKSNETTLILEPGNTSQNFLQNANGFTIKIEEVAAKEEKAGVIQKVIQIIKSYMTCPDYKCDPQPSITFGPRA